MQEQHFDDARAHIQGCLETIDRKRTEAMLRDLITQLKTAEREGRIEDVRVLNGRVNEMRLQKAGRPLGVLSLVKGVSGVSMAKQKLLVEVKKLISIGKEKGFLTYDELNSTLPAEVVSSEQFGSIMIMFGNGHRNRRCPGR